MSDNILVTGGAGFIGANYVRHLHDTCPDCRVVVVDALTYAGNPESIADITDGQRIVLEHADICDAPVMARIMQHYDPQVIVHFAAESHVDRSIDNPEPFIRTNVLGTQTLLEAARRQWKATGALRKFVHVSTDEVYGQLEADIPGGSIMDDDIAAMLHRRPGDNPVTYGTRAFTESTPLAPSSPYSASKASSDLVALAYHHTFGLPVCVTRCSNNYGPYQFPEKLIPLMINNLLEGRNLPVYGRGTNIRDWLYVGDHLRAIDAVAQKGTPGQVYNIGGYNEKRNIDVVRIIINTLRKLCATDDAPYHHLLDDPTKPLDDSRIEYVTDRAGHDMRYAIDPTKTATELGWYPLTSFADGIEKTIRWYLDNRRWVENIVGGEYRNYYRQMYNGR